MCERTALPDQHHCLPVPSPTLAALIPAVCTHLILGSPLRFLLAACRFSLDLPPLSSPCHLPRSVCLLASRFPVAESYALPTKLSSLYGLCKSVLAVVHVTLGCMAEISSACTGARKMALSCGGVCLASVRAQTLVRCRCLLTLVQACMRHAAWGFSSLLLRASKLPAARRWQRPGRQERSSARGGAGGSVGQVES